MSPIEYIAEGIRSGNWETVCEGYERLTGEAIPLPSTPTTSDAEGVLRQIANIVVSALGESVDEPKKPEKKKRGRPKGSGKKKATKKKKKTGDETDPTIQLDEDKRTETSKETGGTQLITNEPDPEEVKRNKAKATKAQKNKVKLGRRAAAKHDVECNECGKTFESDRKGGEMGQKCRSCLSAKKSRF